MLLIELSRIEIYSEDLDSVSETCLLIELSRIEIGYWK